MPRNLEVWYDNKVKPKILFLTNPYNSAPEEDRLLVKLLRRDFDLVVSHPLDCLNSINCVDGVIIRNIWPTHEYQDGWDFVKAALRGSALPIYNPLGFRGEVEGKDYLVRLYNQGFPVIPSIDQAHDLHKISYAEYYWIKPKNSCDGIGAEKITRAELLIRDPKGYIIQPFVQFEYEPSFYFIDGIFHHAIKSKHRLFSDDVAMYEPTVDDLTFAGQFIQWSNALYGTQRVDAIRTFSGKLLLTEIENLCPYLYVAEGGEEAGETFLNSLRSSLQKAFVQTINVIN